ncbi:MAG: 50S ribosomal protein L6 [Sandaracinaceae bacterium]
MAEAQTQQPKLRVSRLGKRPIAVPKGVTIQIEKDGTVLSCKGPKGELSKAFPPEVRLEKDGESVAIVPGPTVAPGTRRFAQFQGMTSALVRNMLEGVGTGYSVSLDLVGVGYRATLKGDTLVLNLGLSHAVNHELHPSVKVKVEQIDEGGTKRPRVHLESHDKEALGHTAARIRSYRPPEPYKGKGVRYTGEHVRQKAGKAGGK